VTCLDGCSSRKYDILFTPKVVGGDEFYVTFTAENATDQAHITAVAMTTDLKNGKYELDFVASLMNAHDPALDNGRIQIHMNTPAVSDKYFHPPGRRGLLGEASN